MLYNVGIEGSLDGDFRYPRGIAIDENNDIIVADAGNNRIQRFNQCAVFKEKFGQKGSGDLKKTSTFWIPTTRNYR